MILVNVFPKYPHDVVGLAQVRRGFETAPVGATYLVSCSVMLASGACVLLNTVRVHPLLSPAPVMAIG